MQLWIAIYRKQETKAKPAAVSGQSSINAVKISKLNGHCGRKSLPAPTVIGVLLWWSTHTPVVISTILTIIIIIVRWLTVPKGLKCPNRVFVVENTSIVLGGGHSYLGLHLNSNGRSSPSNKVSSCACTTDKTHASDKEGARCTHGWVETPPSPSSSRATVRWHVDSKDARLTCHNSVELVVLLPGTPLQARENMSMTSLCLCWIQWSERAA